MSWSTASEGWNELFATGRKLQSYLNQNGKNIAWTMSPRTTLPSWNLDTNCFGAWSQLSIDLIFVNQSFSKHVHNVILRVKLRDKSGMKFLRRKSFFLREFKLRNYLHREISRRTSNSRIELTPSSFVNRLFVKRFRNRKVDEFSFTISPIYSKIRVLESASKTNNEITSKNRTIVR